MLRASPSRVWCPPSCLRGGPVEGRGVVRVVIPVFGLGPAPCIVLPLSRIVRSPFSSCVCCHCIVGLGLCLCDRVMSLWNSGDGVCGVEGRVVSTVNSLRVVVCVQCGVCVVEWRCVRGV